MLQSDQTGRVSDQEGKTLEFKRDLSSPQKLLRSIVAFANSAGGKLVIGVEDDGTVIGVDDPVGEEERIASLVADSIMPRLIPGIDLVPMGTKTVLVVDVPLSTQRPHYLAAKGLAAGTYIRLGSTDRVADAALVADIERSSRGIRFEDLTEGRSTIDELNINALPSMNGQRVSEEDLVSLGLTTRRGDDLLPTNAGILVASPHPDRFIPSAWVQCGRIRGPERTHIVDRMEYHGPLTGAVEPALDFLRKHAFLSARFGETLRQDVWSIPVESLREVIVNALVHANYSEPGTHIRIMFYDDRIVVEGPGLLVAGMTVEGMKNASRLRNPSIARIFRAAGLMENFGTGVRRVYEQLAAQGLPEPRVEEVVDRVRFTVFVSSHAPEDQVVENGEETATERDTYDHTYTKRRYDRVVGRYDVVMLRRASSGPVHRNDLLTAAGLGLLSQNYTRHISPLVSDGLLELTIPGKPRSKAQMYRITDRGRMFLQDQESN